MRLTLDIEYGNPFWEGYPGGKSGILDCRVTRVETRKRFYWPKLQWRLAHRCIVTYISTDIGQFWVWDK